jgi:hypothetical protein
MTDQNAGGVSHESARQAVTAAYHRLATQAQVHNFLPILAARSAQKTLGQDGLYGASTRDQSRRARVLTCPTPTAAWQPTASAATLTDHLRLVRP